MSTNPSLAQSPKGTTITTTLGTAYRFNVTAPAVSCTSLTSVDVQSTTMTCRGLAQTTTILNSGDFTNNGSVTVTGQLIAKSGLSVSGGTTTLAGLSVSGYPGVPTSFNTGLVVSGGLSVISGTTSLAGGLIVTSGTTSLAGLSVISGTTSLNTGLSVYGSTSLTDLCVSGTVTFTNSSVFALTNPLQFNVGSTLVYRETFNPAPISFDTMNNTITLSGNTTTTIYSWNQVYNPLPPVAVPSSVPPCQLILPLPQANLLCKTINFTRTGFPKDTAVTPANLAAPILIMCQLASNSLSSSAQTFALGTFWQKVGFVCIPDPNYITGYPPGYIWDRYFYQ